MLVLQKLEGLFKNNSDYNKGVQDAINLIKSDHYVLETSPDVIDAIGELVDYNWEDEQKNYEESEGESGHIFETLMKISNWLNSLK